MQTQYVEQIRRFYEDHQDALLSYALLITGRRQAAEDVVHTVFSRMLHRGTPPRELRAYVYRCIRNAAIDERRRWNGETPCESIYASENPRNGVEARDAIAVAMEALADDERECVVLKAYSGLTFREIARARRVSINTAASWYRRGLAKMREALEELDP